MTNGKTKPLILALHEAENELVACVNAILQEKQIPCYYFEPIFDKIHRQLKDGAVKELAIAKAQFTNERPQGDEERTVQQNGS